MAGLLKAMAATMFCCYIVRNGPPDISTMCGCPARRMSEGRHYCRDHFEAVIDGAKREVVKLAFRAMEITARRRPGRILTYDALNVALNRLKELGWESGD